MTFETVNNFNLLKIEYQKQVDEMLQNTQLKAHPRGEPVRLIVLDHLTKLTQQATGEKAWGSLRPWFDYLIHDLNLSVLFLHHTSKKGEVYGSSHIVNDVNSQIHINKRSEELEGILPMNITLEENRHGENIKKPIEVNLFLEGKPRLCSNTEDKIANRELWKSLKDEELITEFVRLKQLKNPKKTMSEIADYFGVSKPTIEAFAKKNNLTKGKWENHIPPLDETMLAAISSE